MAKVKERGWLSPIQGLYGLHYHAATMPLMNPKFIASLRKQGFDFFEKWIPVDDTVFDAGELD
jgi:hypothetical protein